MGHGTHRTPLCLAHKQPEHRLGRANRVVWCDAIHPPAHSATLLPTAPFLRVSETFAIRRMRYARRKEPIATPQVAGRDLPKLPQEFGLGPLFDRLRDAVVVADLEYGRIVLWNPAAESLFGFAAQPDTSLPLETLIPDELKVAHRQGVQHYRQTGHGALITERGPSR